MKNLSFGPSVVNAGQRNTSVEAELIATSTNGGFRVTAPVSRALGLAHGDYLVFFNNYDEIENAINQQVPELVEFAEQLGMPLDSAEARAAIHRECDAWWIGKGYVLKDSKGNTQMTTERLSKNDKLKFVTANYNDMLAAVMADGTDEDKDVITREGITEDEIKDYLTKFVEAREIPKCNGAKLANPAQLTGVGTSLTCTDSNVWNLLKSDVDNKESVNKAFAIDVTKPETTMVNNGYEDITVVIYKLGDTRLSEPIQRGSKN